METTLLGGRYRLIDQIGAGGTAEVWRARDERLGRDVAVKLLHRHLVADDAARARVLAEARAVASLTHPGVVTIHDVIEEGDRIGLVLELVQGESLAARIARGPLAPGSAASIAATLADALEAAHRQGIVHRDVKPANVLITPAGSPRIVDFGIAHALDPDAEGLTAPGTVMGTLRWMAPEQLAGAPATRATDIWGLGAVLYAMLAGREPFAATSPAALLAEQRAGPPPIPEVDPELDALARVALAPTPEGRPSSAAELGDALQSWLRGASITAADDPTEAIAPRWGAVRAARAPRRLGRLPIVGTILLSMLLLAGLVGTALLGAGGPRRVVRAENRATPSPAATARPTASPTPRVTAAPVVNANADDNEDDQKAKPEKPKPEKPKPGKDRKP